MAAGLLLLPQAFANQMVSLVTLRAGMAFCVGGLGPIFQPMLARLSPHGERGFIFGWAASLRALGWGLAPLLSGAVATAFDLRAVFVVAVLL